MLISLALQDAKCLHNFWYFDFQVSFLDSFSYASDVFYSKIVYTNCSRPGRCCFFKSLFALILVCIAHFIILPWLALIGSKTEKLCRSQWVNIVKTQVQVYIVTNTSFLKLNGEERLVFLCVLFSNTLTSMVFYCLYFDITCTLQVSVKV